MSLADFKRRADGATMTLIESKWQGADSAHKFLNVPRTVRVRSADMILTDPDGNESHMQFGKSKDWTITNDFAVFDDGGIRLVYQLDRRN